MAEREQVLLEHGFVLHQRPYRDSSQLLECMTAVHGRLGLVARGSRARRAIVRCCSRCAAEGIGIRRGDLGASRIEAGSNHALEGRLLREATSTTLRGSPRARSEPRCLFLL
jgi:hypothetical protein